MEQKFIILTAPKGPLTHEPFGKASHALESMSFQMPALTVEKLTRSELLDVSRAPEFRAAAPEMPTRLIAPVKADNNQENTQIAWGVQAVGADKSTCTGAGVKVAILDTGIDSAHAAFTGVNITEKDFTGEGNGDGNGHGTHCAGTVFGRDLNGTRIGIARGVTEALIGKVLGSNGGGSSLALFEALQWALFQGADVISMSLGFDFPGYVEQVSQDGMPVSAATSLGLEAYRAHLRMFDSLMEVMRANEAFGKCPIVVAASGNESERPKFEIAASLPAAAEGIVSVGALGQSNKGLQIATFSNTYPQLSAPGVNIVSAKAGGGTVAFSGTSMACPHVAGITALWIEHGRKTPAPSLAQGVVAKLINACSYQGLASGYDMADVGYGLVQAPQSVMTTTTGLANNKVLAGVS